MFRVWGKLIKDNHLMKDTVICISDYEMNAYPQGIQGP